MSDHAVAAAPAMTIIVNGEQVSSPPGTLAALVERLGHDPARIATAVNGEFVPARERAGLRLAPGDRVELVSPRQGG